MSHTSTAGWSADGPSFRHGPFPRRGYEIAAIVLGFIVAWPVAVAYLVWKFAGYPVPKVMGESVGDFMERNFDRPGRFWAGWNCRSAGTGSAHRGSTGNLAFEEYRAAELKRLDEERRRLDDEARDFASFVEELKRAKDREEFDAFMKARRNAAPREGGAH